MNWAKKATEALLTESTDIWSYFDDIGLDVEEPTIERPLRKKKKKAGAKKRMVYKDPRA